MDTTKQRIAIAEACGWKWQEPFNKRKKENWLVPPEGRACLVWKDGLLGGNLPPDYLNDLNAMHEAEKVLTKEQAEVYTSLLDRDEIKESLVTDESGGECDPFKIHWFPIFQFASSTAAQRAKAFLRTLGKWEE